MVQGSSLDRANLSFARFVDRYQLVVLALHRAGKDIWRASEEIQDVILQPGDVLLIQGSREQISNLRQSTEFLVLDGGVELPTTNKASTALAILMAVIVVAALGCGREGRNFCHGECRAGFVRGISRGNRCE